MVGPFAALAVVAPFVVGLAVTPSPPNGSVVFRFRDPAIIEASALVVGDGLFVTTNDSGDTGRIFTVDASGQTVGVTHWSKNAVDTESLAPAGPGEVWVGDIGDNLADRPYITVARVPFGRGDRTVHPTIYRLAYPGGPRDAETLVRDPNTGRLYVASKDVFGGTLYAAPPRLRADRVNQLRRVGRIRPLATDGAFLPDGRHLILRGYRSAVVYDWPSLQQVASFELPLQPQGEGIAVADDGSVYLSSEGRRSAVLRMTLPPEVQEAINPATQSPSPSPDPQPSADGADSTGTPSRELWPWALGGLVGIGAVVVLVRSLRPR